MKNIYSKVLRHKESDLTLVLATVTSATGSTPGKPGNSALFGSKGLIAGTVGGGVVEGRISEAARTAATTGKSGFFHFDLANDISKGEEAICGGKISLLVDANPARSSPVFERASNSLANSIPGVLITVVTEPSAGELEVDRHWFRPDEPDSILPELKTIIIPEANNLLASSSPGGYAAVDLPETLAGGLHKAFLEKLVPLPKLVVAGAGHIGRALAHLGAMVGFEVTVIDDRPEYANQENIPDADRIIVEDIGKAVSELASGRDTYIVIVTRGHRDDAAALRSCIGTDCTYTGMIGSRRKIAAMKEEFLSKGWATPGQWERIYAPVGLEIKSQSVEEIAVSITAQLIMVRNSR